MKNILLIIFLLFISFTTNAQNETKRGNYALHQLRKTKTAFPDYLNFDVVKFMFPLNRGNSIKFTGFNLQLLWPYSLFKRKWYHSVFGLTLGNNKKMFPGQQLNFTDKGVEPVSDNDIKHTLQKRNFVGVTFLYCRRFGSWFTLLAGPSVQYNFYGKIWEKYIDPADDISFRNSSAITKFSIPLTVQLSWSRIQAASLGIFFSRDLAPLYKGDHKNIKQTLMGVSWAIIL